jgi:recombinational DNA repair protein RecR
MRYCRKELQKGYVKKLYHKRISTGFCGRCGKEKIVKKSYCEICADYVKQRNKNSRSIVLQDFKHCLKD